jgi:hypothetical protein
MAIDTIIQNWEKNRICSLKVEKVYGGYFLRHTDGLSNGELLSLVKIKGKMGFLPERLVK